jgi:mono/diheme cytochrome c family protein
LKFQKGTERWVQGVGGSFAALALACLVASGCKSQPELTPQQAEGQHLYAVRCAHCHEENDLALKPPPPNIHGVMAKPHLPSGAPATDADVRRLVLVGKGKMPSFSGRFTEGQMAALLAYLHTEMPLSDNEAVPE